MRRSRTSREKSPPKSSIAATSAVGLGVAALAAAPAANAAVFNVTTLADSGAGSLRQAIIDANGAAGADVITFQAALSGTITLTTGQLYITDSVDVQGPGAAVITVSGNNSSRVFYMYNGSGEIDVRIAGLTITEGSDVIGAGVVNFDENLILDGVTITENNSVSDGAGLWADGFNMDLTITNSTISGNIAGGDGGGIYIEDTGGPLLIEESVISGNQAAGSGGGIYFYDPDDDITIRDTTISGNTSVGGVGGGVYLYSFDAGSLTIERTTVSGNTALGGGGLALYGLDVEPALIENSTISGNQATSFNGGGIYLYNLYAELVLNFVTVAGNTSVANGGGMSLGFGPATINNSIFGDNTAAADDDLTDAFAGTFDLRYTLVESPGSAPINDIEGNIFNTDPQLAALADNGGPTETQRPALTSPVVNAADPALVPPPATDQRGEPRFYPTRADMGALELVGGVIQFNPTVDSVAENAGSITLTVVRDVGPDPASVDFTTNPGTATAGPGNDYTTTSGTLNFAAGDLSETFNVPILDDATVEGSEQFTATLSNPSPDATIGAGNPATVTITDFETGQIVFSSATYSVGETGGVVTITVNRVNGSDGAASVNYTTVPGTATPGVGNDYTTTGGTFNWADGDATSRSFDVPILDDDAAEGDEDFGVSLDTPSGAAIGTPGTATVTIIDDPAGTAQFSVASIDTTEEAGTVTVTVTRTGGTEGPLSVNYSTADGTATTPSDYTAAAGIITFPAGSAVSQTFDITLIDDNVPEGEEMFTANLSGPGTGTPSSVTIVLAASDAVIAPIPTVSWLGKVFLTIMSAMAGLYVMMRNRLSLFLLAMLCAGVFAAPPLSAAEKTKKETPKAQAEVKKKENKGSKFSGTVQSIESNGASIVMTLSGGIAITIPKTVSNITDVRSAKPQPGTLQQIVAGTQVVVKMRTDANGVVKSVKIKITG
ncbi:MAG: right-handed parallel beta-helix repeat-containing protein [Acidobacteriota bacterium]|nr:right-handed parallel beta-helix repeat-containing protein [Acidobacteriota bacterium]